MALKIFVDFDGTITTDDVGNSFFVTFGGRACEAYVEEYRRGIISAQECFRRELAEIGTIDQGALARFLAAQRIDPGFSRFVEFCRSKNIEFHIVSDGLDYYIKSILEANSLGGISFFSNVLHVSEPDSSGRSRLSISYPYGDAECCVCACCKRNIMLTHAGDDDVIGYVGEGFSDQCPVGYADIVFAKDALQTYCQRENISYYLYRTFDDVVGRLDVLLSRKSIRKRRRAELRRREVYASEP
jgi:2-hydroxy-3-keto-5-methylthiopentenyl-1-phosphate phosphatase